MRLVFAKSAVVVVSLAAVALWAAETQPRPAVSMLDDFESGRINWTGDYRGSIVAEYPSHGEKSFRVVFQAGAAYPGISAGKIDRDWSGYDTLRMDIYNPQGEPANLTIRIDDDKSTGYSSRYNGEFLLVNGQTFLEIPFAKITAGDRPIDVSQIAVLTIFMSSPEKDTILYFDNIRVTRGREPEGAGGRRIISAPDGPAIIELEEKARDARNRLDALIPLAHQRGIGTLEPNIALVTAELGLEVRPKLPWFEGRKAELYSYVADSCGDAYRALADTMEGRRPISPVPPVYDAASLRFAGAYFAEEGLPAGAAPPSPARQKTPVLVFSMLYHQSGPLCEYFTPVNYFTHTHSFAGASRYDVEKTPLYRAYHEHGDTHRVWNGDEGWCGHIVRDSASLGGGKEPVVVCLESPHTRRAIEEYIREKAGAWKDDPKVKVNIMGGELSYICYCKYTLGMFREYLRGLHGSVGNLNSAWGTKFTSFDEVDVMPNARQAAENRGRWYDWQAFNCYRFVEHARWAKSVIRSIDAEVPVSLGAVTYSLRADFGRSGVDEENLIREVDDVVLNESGPSTITTDLLWSLSEGAKPMFDFEYHGDVAGILPHFLHGNTAMAMWWWPDEPDTQFPQFNETALPSSWNIPLADVAECLKIALDIRRLSPVIASFASQPAEIAILYSRASMLQVPAEFVSGTQSPYTMELENAYNAALGLDAPVRFVSSRQIEEGKLSKYKVLIVPAAAYVYDAEAQAIFDFAAGGGTVVITPNSLMFDEYARPRGHLARLGISVKEIREPAYAAGGVRRDAFLQGFIRETSAQASAHVYSATKGTSLVPDGTIIEGAGVFQTVGLSGSARAVAFTPGGAPTLVEVPLGKGVFYYLTVPLGPESLNLLLDAVAAREGVPRPVRLTLVSGGRDWRIEGRAVEGGNAVFFYMTNHAGAPLKIKANLPFAPARFEDLRDPWRKTSPDSIDLAPGRTRIFAAVRKGPGA